VTDNQILERLYRAWHILDLIGDPEADYVYEGFEAFKKRIIELRSIEKEHKELCK